ncbi:hypothetical protein [Rhizorhabdus dicambivorans]|uniref:Uncharacterized protein n=1 Tax=Rhizorhabdus dicambivorans TaxID=1850238 RepID=A0A2A4FTJ8_9SPHN|nr:hypothetical protein [Rhizorhabdus dicambivorans]PCE40768.1 hypothetical protein COO09_18820 [Rhizorhabdus dicambivorans]
MSDLDYYRERLAQESQAARSANCPEAEMIHRSLAAAYARKALGALQDREDGAEAVHGKVVGLRPVRTA